MIKVDKTIINGHKYCVSDFPATLRSALALELSGMLTEESQIGQGAKLGRILREAPELVPLLFSATTRDDMAINEDNVDILYANTGNEMIQALTFIVVKNFLATGDIGSQKEPSQVKEIIQQDS